MATFTGTGAADYIYAGYISSGVLVDPAGYGPSSAVDTIYGNGGNDWLDGSGGNDSVFGGAGNDTTFGGAGNDFMDDYTASSFGGSDSMDGGSGNDTLYGYDGYDTLLGGDGADFLYGEDGGDLLNGGAGADIMTGGADGDTYYVDDAGDVVVEANEYGLDQVYSGATFTLGSYIERLELTGRNDLSGTGNDSGNDIRGNDGRNTLNGLGGNDTLSGGLGADTLVGGTGNDTYLVEAGDVLVEASGGGTDTVSTSSNVTLGAEIENLELYANGIVAYGNGLDNVMDGNGYSATLAGGTGNDLYILKDEDSTVVEGSGGGTDKIELYFGHPNNDNANYFVVSDNIENTTIHDHYHYDYYYNYDYYYYDSQIVGNSTNNTIDGGEGDNTISGMDGADTLYGNGGDDTFDGGAGTDRFDGGDGSDWVVYTSNTTPVKVDLVTERVTFPGTTYTAEVVIDIENARTGSGNDIFIGNSEDNRFSGNAGDDTFEGGGGQDYFLGGGGVDTVLYTSNTTSVNVDLANGHASFPGQSWPTEDFDYVENASTGSGADTLTGSSAANELHGGGGADKLKGAAGADKLFGGAANDTFLFAAGDSGPGARDILFSGDGGTAFDKAGKAAGDTIDVGAIDANTTAGGNQPFIWGGSGKGHLWAVDSGNLTLIRGNTDNDAAIEFELAISDASVKAAAYTAADFIL